MNTVHTAVDHQWATSRRFRTAAILGSLTALAPLSIDMYLPSLPVIAKDLHASTSVVQLSITLCLIGLALGQLVAGPLSDARGRRGPLLTGLAVYVLASFVCAVTPNIWLLVALRFVQGFAGAAGIVIARAIARDLYSGPELTRFFSLLMLVNGVAPILAPVLGGQLLRVMSWRGVFVVLGGLGIGMFVTASLALRETLHPEHRRSGGVAETVSTFSVLLRERTFIGYALSQGLVNAAMFGYISGSPFVLQNIYGLSPQMFSVCFAINGLGIILFSRTSGVLAGRVADVLLFRSGIGIAACGGLALLASVLFHFGLAGVLPTLFLLVSSVGVVGTIGSALAMQNQARSAGSAAALIGVAQLLLGAVASPLVGLGGSHTDVPMGVVIAVCDVGAVVVYTLLAGRGRRQPD
ncbi:multidrug effflux MFS transporter [Alicyclobacillus fastidiosus]|uniref:Bcr/CflA family efflux transporter n=1 Tax=Alicyclobacillus fastidiosus TaxID=392011 RepID=A0ABY6ZFP6_9BACL|nr:multidrug effflux MFS transporter [Alicyclobacillus fastidiosus]WAH41560.1 multidrug effflux MFS transporter [Alicyclobacillus fastidiosus]GMA63219.1 Bcr/CflA family drug resistance efflux transporter [Alicyclobacillus fastidiosus]